MPDHLPPLALAPLAISADAVGDLAARLDDAIIRAEAMADEAHREMVAAEAEHRAANDAWQAHDNSICEHHVDLCWTDAHKATQRHDRARQAVDDLAAAQKLIDNAAGMLRLNEAAR